MPRQSRRARLQTGGRKRTTPLIPRHLIDGAGPATLEPPDAIETAETDDAVVEERDEAPEMASAPRISRGFSPAPPETARPASGFTRRAQQQQPVERNGASLAARLASTDYGYVVGELKRIFITAAVIVLLLIVVAVLRHTT